MDRKDLIPPQLQPAVKHIREVFDSSDFKCGYTTQRLCFADLHPGTVIEEELAQYRLAFIEIRNILGSQISNQFDVIVSPGTPSAILHGYAELYRYGLSLAVRDMFIEALQIGFNNTAAIGKNPVTWAKSQVENRIQNGRHRFTSWIKNVCDLQPFSAKRPMSDEEVEEMIWWRKWRAPRFIHMRPSGNTPYDESTAWTREDEDRTSQILNGLSQRFTEFVEIGLDKLVGKAHVQMAKSGVATSRSSVADVSKPDTGAPTVFISYSWDDPEHQQWVTNLAERLQGKSGVQIVFDRWHLNPGDDKLRFMEQAVATSDFVIVVCTPNYAERANKREGGVGYESTIITAQMAKHMRTNKFIPILRKGSWSSSLPIYLESRLGVNLSDDPYHEDEYEKLLRVLHKEPLQPPPLGSKPDFSKKPSSTRGEGDSVSIEAKDGSARFRASDQALGLFWSTLPFAQTDEYEVFLAKGPAMWFRIMPQHTTGQEWSHDELMKCARKPSIPLQPLLWSNLHYLRAEDGIGAYATIDNLRRETETKSVAFAFNTGEIWCVDTTVLQLSGKKNLYFIDIARVLTQKLHGYGEFLKCLGIEPPYNWVAGLEGVKGWRLQVPPPPNHVNVSSGETCLSDVVMAGGPYNLEQPAAATLRPFFNQLFRKCSTTIPEHIEEMIRTIRR